MRKIYLFFCLLMISSLSFGQLIINEVLYDPSNSGLDGDANGDGVYGQEEDSFIEFVNTGSAAYDASGIQIWDDTSNAVERFIIPPGTIIPAGGAMVVFGGQTPTGTFGGAIVIVADTAADGKGLSLNNSGEIIVIKDANGMDLLYFNSDSLSNNPNESYTRFPDLTGEFLQHGDTTAVLFSPGTQTDGTPFSPSTSVSEVASASVSIFPNPTTEFIRIQTQEKVSRVLVYNLTGKVLITETNEKLLNVKSLPNGVYFMQIETENRKQVVQFVKK